MTHKSKWDHGREDCLLLFSVLVIEIMMLQGNADNFTSPDKAPVIRKLNRLATGYM